MAPTTEKGLLLQWKGRTNYVVYLLDRPQGHQITTTSSLIFHESVGSRLVKTTVRDLTLPPIPGEPTPTDLTPAAPAEAAPAQGTSEFIRSLPAPIPR
jgi:hypothetical protein